MKPTPTSSDLASLLAFGAHPDDIEFGCGAVVAKETRGGRRAHFVICSRGESGSNGSAEERVAESQKGAAILRASVEFIELDGDGKLEMRAAHAMKLARIIRRERPAVVLAPSLVENQHPDHAKLGAAVRDAARLARYGGIEELKSDAPHAIGQLLFYAITAEAEMVEKLVLVDVSGEDIQEAWIAAMEAHATQMRTRNYVELQLLRARLNGLRAGVGHAIALYPSDPLLIDSLAQLGRGARAF